ncbi:MAG: EAL domain-containing protein, partial [Pseudohongiellaceae bacterium]
RLLAEPVFLPFLITVSTSDSQPYWLKKGFNDVLLMPILKAELLARVRSCLMLNRHSQRANEQSVERFRMTVDQAPSGIVHTARSGWLLLVNRRMCEMFGCTEEEMLKLKIMDLTHPEDRASNITAAEKMVAGVEESFHAENRYIRKNGEVFWGELWATLIKDSDGKPQYYIAIVTDISPRKALEYDLTRIAQARQARAVCSHVLVHATDEEKLLADMCEAVVDIGTYRSACALSLERSNTKCPLRVGACAGADSTWIVRCDEEFSGDYTASHGLLAKVLDHCEPFIEHNLSDVFAGEGYWWQQIADSGVRSLMLVPLRHGDTCYGGLAILAEAAEAFNVGELKLISALAEEIAFGISSIRSESARKRSEQQQKESEQELRLAEGLLRASETRLEFLLSSTPAVIYASDTTPPFTATFISDNFESQFGYPPRECLASSDFWLSRVHPDDRPVVMTRMMRINKEQINQSEYRFLHADGDYRWVRDAFRYIRIEGQDRAEVVGYMIDITEQKSSEARLLYMAHFDELTNLPNRTLLRDRLNQAMSMATRNNWYLGILFLDLDRFKIVNDTLGHTAGDELLIQVTQRLRECIRTEDTLGRLGGDEFAIILTGLQDPASARVVAAKIKRRFDIPFNVRRRELFVSVSIGITIFPDDSGTVDDLIKNADTAMYSVKDAGRNNFRFFTSDMNEKVSHRLELETSLRRAIERKEFVLHYQPKFGIRDRELIGFEALIRWQRPEVGLVSPMDFVPVLEETGMIVEVGQWVLRETCRQIREWREKGLGQAPVSINLSARQLQEESFPEYVRRVLREEQIEPELIELEITESALMVNPEQAAQFLRQFKADGISISIDDFGTGYSSLSYLKTLPLTTLKIDRGFVKDLPDDVDDATITRTIITMATQLGLNVIAEGVETEAQSEFLLQNGCNWGQGFLYGKPVAATEVWTLFGRSSQ